MGIKETFGKWKHLSFKISTTMRNSFFQYPLYLTLVPSEHVWMGEEKSNKENIHLRKTKFIRGFTGHDSFVRAKTTEVLEITA